MQTSEVLNVPLLSLKKKHKWKFVVEIHEAQGCDKLTYL